MAIKRNYRFYKGYMECQYKMTDRKQLGKKDANLQHKIKLEPRFRCYEWVEIDAGVYDLNTRTISSPYIKHNLEEQLELIDLENPGNTISTRSDEIVLIMNTGQEPGAAGDNEQKKIVHEWSQIQKDVQSILKRKSALPINQFLSQKGMDSFGKFHGFVFFRTYTETQIPDPPKGNQFIDNIDSNPEKANIILQQTQCKFILENGQQCSRMVDAGNDFCFQHRQPIDVPINTTSNKGCFDTNNIAGGTGSGSSCFGLKSSGCFPQSGCFGFRPPGCFPPILQWLLGLGSLLIGIALLALAWCFIFGDCGKGRSGNNTNNKTDTVYVEVFRELKDTLKIVKMDTVAFVDSTVKSKYEMVSLPNVQFYTDSDVLLPSSAKELQQLAEYLTKNPAVNAIIIGHTDNTGDPTNNLDLSKRRAESVKRFLQSIGVTGDRLQAKGMGDRQPKADNNTKEGRLMNRRVEVQLLTEESTETKRTQVPRKEAVKP